MWSFTVSIFGRSKLYRFREGQENNFKNIGFSIFFESCYEPFWLLTTLAAKDLRYKLLVSYPPLKTVIPNPKTVVVLKKKEELKGLGEEWFEMSELIN